MVLRQHRKDLEDLWDQVGQGDPVAKHEDKWDFTNSCRLNHK